ncbi:hypothetical protein Cgig2_023899 [Carnegiea gigantea]|uniref:Uncharacterized protein n=1 Tax=Carnegiea gigantea TaxID=171969 RepID=A0A9Q1GVS7_9CARY|nr:hypothetical protein Cgig2_023899 [Carnegiea gigantea]
MGKKRSQPALSLLGHEQQEEKGVNAYWAVKISPTGGTLGPAHAKRKDKKENANKSTDEVEATMHTGFGGFLSVRTSTIPKDLATWLFENFDPASNTLKLSDNRKLQITKKDVHTALEIPMGQLEVQVASICKPTNEYNSLLKQWRTRWNLGRIGTPKVGKMVE